MSLFDDLERRTTNPLFLAGAGLLMGEGFGGMTKGMQMGQQFQVMRRKQAEEDEEKERWAQYTQGGMGGVPENVQALVRAMGRDGASIAGKSLMEKHSEAEQQKLAAQNILLRAQANYYNSRSAALARPPQAVPQPHPSQDPLSGLGIDESGNMTGWNHQPATQSGGHSQPFPQHVPSTTSGRLIAPGVVLQDAPDEAGLERFKPNFSGRMNLGGPMNDIDRSMRLDEGRPRPQGVQVAQAGGLPTLFDQARQRAFGPAGVQSPEVPGVVTDAGRNRRVDVPATREMQGQRAYDAATPEQQDRLRRMRHEQAFWTNAYGRPPRAGYYYGPDGREMQLTDKNFKGDRESQAVAKLNMDKIESAGDVLLGKRTGRVDEKGNQIRDAGPNLAQRAIMGGLNAGEIGQAFADMKQGAIGIAYALSGKTVAVAEMKSFVEAYGPTPFDGPERIANKMQRMRQFYEALLTASRGGESYENAFARAMAVSGLKNPDGSPAGQPAAASAGLPKQGGVEGLQGLSNEELMRRAFGGR